MTLKKLQELRDSIVSWLDNADKLDIGDDVGHTIEGSAYDLLNECLLAVDELIEIRNELAEEVENNNY